jgi:hypothetical protein
MTPRSAFRSAVLMPLVAVALSACGGGSGDEDADDPAGVLTYRQLTDALLPEGSMVGSGEVGPEDLQGFADERTADPESCQPLSAVVDLDPEPVRSGRVQVDIKFGAWVQVQLSTYADDDAARIMALVDEAIVACASGYVDDRTRPFTVSEVLPEEGPALGDDVVAFATTSTDPQDAEPLPLVEHTVLVRDGQHLLSFRAGSLDEDEEARALLDQVVAAQWERYVGRG